MVICKNCIYYDRCKKHFYDGKPTCKMLARYEAAMSKTGIPLRFKNSTIEDITNATLKKYMSTSILGIFRNGNNMYLKGNFNDTKKVAVAILNHFVYEYVYDAVRNSKDLDCSLIYFVDYSTFINTPLDSSEFKYMKQRMMTCKLLAITNITSEPTRIMKDQLMMILTKRVDNLLSTIYTGNKNLSLLSEYLGEDILEIVYTNTKQFNI